MTDNLHIADTDLALYAIGALPRAEAGSVADHVKACAVCSEELRRNTLALGAYAQTTPAGPLPDGAKQRFMTRLATTPQVTAAQIARPQVRSDLSAPAPVIEAGRPWRSFFTASAPWSFALAASLAVALLVVGVDDVRRRAEMGSLVKQAQRGAMDSAQFAELMDLLTSQQVKKVALHQAPVAVPVPEGRVVYEANSGKLLLTASNLHPLPAGKTYELWILQPGGKKPLPAGTFAPDASGYAAMILADAPAGLAVQGFGVTIENEGGSQTPTLPIVLSGM